MADLAQLETEFIKRYGGREDEIRVFHAPGRVNLIGEHTDYNGGYVFPAALTFGTTMLIRPNGEQVFRFASTHFPQRIEASPNSLAYRQEDDWANYPKAMLFHLMKRDFQFSGYDVLYHGDIPNGAGLSSSASIEVVTGYGFLSMESYTIDNVQLALIAQEAENEYIGVNCGIMDQFAVANGQRNHAIKLKCNTLEYELVPFQASGYKLVIGNTNKRRGLVDSEYNARRAQCEAAVHELRKQFPNLQLLGELSIDQFTAASKLIADDTVRRRAQHVIEENDRVLRSVQALQSGDLHQFGQLMIESHKSLKELYEVTGVELDTMVEEALRIDGVLGSRMTGAGFGGCTVSLVSDESVEQFVEQTGKRYRERTGLQAEFYVAEIGDGVREVK